jgi:uncharacterized protein (DUF342 family)
MYNVKRLLDHRNMMIAVKKGVVPRYEFRSALKEQRHLEAKTKSFKCLNEILIDRGILTKSQLESVLASLLGSKSSEGIPLQSSQNNYQAKNVACPLPEDESKSKESPDNKSEKECLEQPPQKGLALIITKDGLVAYISVKGNKLNSPSLKDVHRLLANRNIVFGILDDKEIEKKLEEALTENASFQIAAGIPPEPGEPDQITYHFDTNPFRVGTVTEDGLMDWKERGEYPYVEKDTPLATLTPGKKSVPGKDIFGNALVADEVPRLHLFSGKGVGKSKDRLQLFAKVGGQPQLTGRGNVSVIQTLDIKGDIGVETGHVDFEGHIEVRGAVEKGYRVKGDSLRAKEILSEEVEIIGDVVAIRGVFGAKIRCQGRVKANHINKSTIIADGDVAVAKEIVECTIITNGKCIIDGGTILSSEIYAKKGLKAKDVGSEASHPNKLMVGIDQIAKIKVAEFKDQINQNKNEIEILEKEIAVLNQESDRLNTELGQIAQVQDNYMVSRRKIADVVEKEQRDLTAQEQAAISALSLKMEEIDKNVGTLMDRDEETQARVVTLRNQTVELDNNINALDEEIKQVELFAKRDMGIPTAQISGKLYQGTEIVGPHDSLVIEKNLYNAFFKEQKSNDKEAEKPYSFKISHR